MSASFTNLLFHIVFSTKYRQPWITLQFRPELANYLGGILRNEGGVLIEIGIRPDHVHLLVKLRPDVSMAECVRVLKSNSSKWAKSRCGTEFAWQSGYAAFSVSASQAETVQRYLQRQDEHHRVVGYQDELVAFLRRHEIAFDDAYLWT